MSTVTKTIQLEHLDSRIKSVWQRSQMLHLASGLLRLCRWAGLIFVIAVALDWMIDIPAVGRGAILIALLSISLYRAWQSGWRDLRGFDATHTALKLERHHGGLESLLVSAVQLRDKQTVAGTSESMREKTISQANEAAEQLRADEAVPFGGLSRPAVVVLLLCGLIGAVGAVNSPFLTVGFSRIFAPWLAVQYPTYTQLDVSNGDLVVKQGASVQIKAGVSGVIPDTAKLLLSTGEGRPREIILDIKDHICEYTIATTSRDFTYQIEAGDARSAVNTVKVISGPQIENVQVDLEFPTYLQRKTETVEALTLTVPERTSLKWEIILDRPVSKASFIRDGEQPVKLQLSKDGHLVDFAALASDSRGYSFSWIDKEYGFKFESSRYYLQVDADQSPQVELTSPASNLIAMLGRPLQLAVRAHDDHSIEAAKISYRVNRRPDEFVDIPSLVANGSGDQAVDWDYRTAMSDLVVGDTVSFRVEVSDRYPGPDGPHLASSETRRITFLSKEEYLKQIEDKKNRLLSLVRTIYRQERSSHEIVRNLNPKNDSFMQSCQLEAIRQEMVRKQLHEIADQIQVLLDDLAANNVSDAPQGESLNEVRSALLTIAEENISKAAQLLRAQIGGENVASDTHDPAAAARVVNTAARELGSLVLLRDIDSAQEVFARETHMLAQIQASLRWRTATNNSAAGPEALANEQGDLASWTDGLISDIQDGMRYDKRPLAILRLTRSTKDLRDAQIEATMQQASESIRDGITDQANSLQSDSGRTLLDAEFSVRLSGAYSTLIKTRNALQSLAEAQASLSASVSTADAATFKSQQKSFKAQQNVLRKKLLTLLLPTVPPPRSRLFDQTPPKVPPVEKLMSEIDLAMAKALSQLGNNNQELASSEQRKAESALIELTDIVERWSVETGLQTQGLGTLVAATSERLSRIEEYEAKVVGLLDKTDIAASKEQQIDSLAAPQLILTSEIDQFLQDLVEQNEAEPDRDLPPLLSRLEQATRSLNEGAQSLKTNSVDDALEHQGQAADALAEAYVIVAAQNERLSLLQDLLMFQRAVGFANGYMADIVTEQRDLLAATETGDIQAALKLMPQFRNMHQCMEEVAPLLDMVAARLDVGTPLAFAKADFEDAMTSLEIGDKLDAIDAQDVAAESLAKVQFLVGEIQTQTGYIAEIVEFLHAAASESAMLRYRQRELRNRVTSDQHDATTLAKEQAELFASVNAYAQQLTLATGMAEFKIPVEYITSVQEHLESGNTQAAYDEMVFAELTLTENTEALSVVISMLHGLPRVEVIEQTEPELVRLIDVLALASDHKTLFRNTQLAAEQDLSPLSIQQQAIAIRCDQISQAGDSHDLLVDASKSLSEAVTAFKSSDRELLKRAQIAADEKLRHYIVQQALFLNTALAPTVDSEGLATDDGEGTDSESAFSAGFISDFVSGETPKDSRTGWKVLGDRNRASLNQNFARELPLEYRGLLKNYYERVAK